MTTRWRLASIEVENFRGVTGQVAVDLRPGLNVLTGENGAGKTSFCHAIEWALFGKLPVLVGGEFQAEDAITSRIAAGNVVSRVRLALEMDGDVAIVTRTRPRGSSSTRGTSNVTVELNRKTMKGKDADTWIAELVGVPLNEFGACIYLRQDTIADLVLGDEDLRSAVIDKLLGLGEIRELLENLQLGPIERSIKQLDEEVSSQRENVISAATMRRGQLARKRETLAGRGLDESALTAPAAASTLAAAWEGLKAAAPSGIEVSEAQARQPEVGQLILAADELSLSIQRVQQALTNRTIEVGRQADRLQDLRDRCDRAGAAARELSEIDLEALRGELEQLRDVVRHAASEATEKRQLHLTIKPLCEQLVEMALGLKSLRESVAALEGKGLSGQHQNLDGDISAAQAQLQRESSLVRVLIAAKDHLTQHPGETCPVCDQSIRTDTVVSRLDQLIAQQGQHATDMADHLRRLRAALQEVTTLSASLDKDKAALGRAEARWQELVDNIRKAGVKIIADSSQAIQTAAATVERESQDSSARQATLEEDQRKLDTRIRVVESARGELEAVRFDVQKLVGAMEPPSDMLAAIALAEADTKRRHQTILDSRQTVEQVQGRLVTIREVLAYLDDEKEVAELEQNVPPVARRIRQLMGARARVLTFRGAILEVQNALSAVQDEALRGNLANLLPGVQEVFTALGGHPEFRQLLIEPSPDEKSGTNTYLVRAQSDDGGNNTFVRTIFSRGELNAVALSLFLAVSRASDSNLGVTVLDDPAQSLDLARKRSLAEILREFAQERQILIATEDLELIDLLKANTSSQLINLVHKPYQGTVAQT